MTPRTLTAALSAVLLPLLTLTLGVGALTGGAATTCPTLAAGQPTDDDAAPPSPVSTPSTPAVTSGRVGRRAARQRRASSSASAPTSACPPRGRSSPWPPPCRNPGYATSPTGTATPSACSSSGPPRAGAPPTRSAPPPTPPPASTRHCWPSRTGSSCRSPLLRRPSNTATTPPPTHSTKPRPVSSAVSSRAGSTRGAPAAVQAYLANPDCLFGGGDGLPETAAAALPAGYTLPSTTPPAVRTAITWALAQLGTPYSYGGDCTAPPLRQPRPPMRLLQPRPTGLRPRRHPPAPHHRRPSPRRTNAVASLAQIQPGDLVFIPGANGTRARPGHVGLYIGKGLIVQAPRTGANIKLTNLNTWAPQVAALRRIA